MQLHNPIVAMKSSAQRATRYWADRRGVPNQPRRRSLGGCDNGSSPAKAVQMDVDDVMVLDAPPRRQVRARRYRSKLLQFHKDEQVRPAYFGSHRPSKVVKGRRPKARDPDVDYDYESWDDWEEPDEDAESLKSEDDKDDKDDEEGDEADGQFVVPDGYLSAEEARSEDGGGDAEAAAATAESGAVAGMDEAKLSLILCGRCVSAEVPPSAAAHALRRRVDASVRAAARKQSSVLLIAPGCGLKAPVAEEEGDGSPSAKAAKEAARAAKAAEKQERDAAKAAEKAAKDEARAAKAKEKQERDAAKAAEKAAKEAVKAAKEEEERKKKEAEAAKVERQKANAMKAFFKLGVKRESLDNNNNDDNNDNNGDNSSGAGVEAGAAGAADDPIALDE
ncbi:chromatin assembly factor 1 subunit A [Pycnococcus provasolii]